MTDTALPDPQEFYKENPTEVRFLDPVTGVELKTGEPPPSLLDDPLAPRGLKQLKKMGAEKRLIMQLIQNLHGGAEDFHDMVRDSGDVLFDAKLVIIEIYWRKLSTDIAQTDPSAVEYIFADYPGRKRFQKEQLSWLNERNKIVLSCEFSVDDTSKFLTRQKQLIELCWTKIGEKDYRTGTILYGAYQFPRQWLFLAQLGNWLHQLESEGLLPKGELKIPFMLGGHQAMVSKLEDYFGIPVENYVVTNRTLGPSPMDPNYDQVFLDMTTHARVTQKHLAKPLVLS